jgi:hypothetical protein
MRQSALAKSRNYSFVHNVGGAAPTSRLIEDLLF